jgi:ankyrin repeat protein
MASEESDFEVDEEATILRAFERATQIHRLCPNRVWAITETLPGKTKSLPILFPPNDERLERVFSQSPTADAEDRDSHDRCTFSFCERSQMDFTAVPQRHESRSCRDDSCGLIKGRFDSRRLDVSIHAGGPTAWHLNGTAVIAPGESFMAVSHCWSDGTGAGAWPAGQINRCLCGFFASIARQLGCQGIWWDTICIPREKSARVKAISSMHQNYEDAKVTLVHDCFLRNLEWVDAETACLAIVMSPWFSRGWTALELQRSHTVKVLFKEKHGLVLKDLDHDILKSHGPWSQRHELLANAIGQLREKDVSDLDQLLTVLGRRHTSWSRDLAIIAGHLVGVPIAPGEETAEEVYQQDIYQKILRRFSVLRHGHLFHNAPTLHNATSWCPTNLFDVPFASEPAGTDSFLGIETNGDVVGSWTKMAIGTIPESHYVWKDVHPLTQPKFRSALRHPTRHIFLVEPGQRLVDRALLVRQRSEDVFQRIGCMNFHPPQRNSQGGVAEVVWIVNSEKVSQRHHPEQRVQANAKLEKLRQGQRRPSSQANPNFRRRQSDVATSVSAAGNDRQVTSLCSEVVGMSLGGPSQQQVQSSRNLTERDQDGRTILSHAAEQGDEALVEFILGQCEQPLRVDGNDSTRPEFKPEPLKLLELLDTKDVHSMTPLSWAALEGHVKIVEKLILWSEVDIHSTSPPPDVSRLALVSRDRPPRNEIMPLHFAAEQGHTEVVKALLDAGASTSGNVDIVDLLLWAGADIEAQGRYKGEWVGRSLHVAVANGHDHVVELLLNRGAIPRAVMIVDEPGQPMESIDPEFGILKKALRDGHVRIAQMLISAEPEHGEWLNSAVRVASAEGYSELVVQLVQLGANISAIGRYGEGSALYAAAQSRWRPGATRWNSAQKTAEPHLGNTFETVRVILQMGADVNAEGGEYSNALQAASSQGRLDIVKLLLSHGADVNAKGGLHGSALEAAKQAGHEDVVKLLQSKGAKRFPFL